MRLAKQPNSSLQCLGDDACEICIFVMVIPSRIGPREEREGEVLGCFADVRLGVSGSARVGERRGGCEQVDRETAVQGRGCSQLWVCGVCEYA